MSKNKLEWYGEAPNDWFIKKGKYLYKFIQTGKRDSGENNPNGKYPFFTCSKEILNIDKYSFEMEALLVAGNGIVGETKYYNGKFDAYQRVYVISDFTSEIHVPYLKIYMMNNFMIYLTWRMIGSVINFVKLEDIKNFDITFPKIEKQIQITEYLNNKLGKIDRLIENQQQQIEKLKEYKHSLISEVVTKGLDPNVEMMDSGIEWIGKIPKHWDILQLKRIGKVVNGSTPKSDNSMFWDGEICWATPTDFTDGQIIDDTARKITDLGYSSCNTTLVQKGSILITCRAPIGNVAINDKDMCFNQGCKAIVTNIDNRYLYYFLVCMNEPLNIHGQGTTFLEISTNSLSNFMIVYPAESERNLIANYLDLKINEMDAIISIKTKKIEKLNEYKKSLIYEYVTGKKEVS